MHVTVWMKLEMVTLRRISHKEPDISCFHSRYRRHLRGKFIETGSRRCLPGAEGREDRSQCLTWGQSFSLGRWKVLDMGDDAGCKQCECTERHTKTCLSWEVSCDVYFTMCIKMSASLLQAAPFCLLRAFPPSTLSPSSAPLLWEPTAGLTAHRACWLPAPGHLWSSSVEGVGIAFTPVWVGDARQRLCILQAKLRDATHPVFQASGPHSFPAAGGSPSALQGPWLLLRKGRPRGRHREEGREGDLSSFTLCMAVLKHLHRHRAVRSEGYTQGRGSTHMSQSCP